MTPEEYYYGKLAEEAGEIVQIAFKTASFGPTEVYPVDGRTNAERVCEELNDLLGVIEELNERYGLNFKPDPERIAAKRVKMAHYLDYMRSLGRAQES